MSLAIWPQMIWFYYQRTNTVDPSLSMVSVTWGHLRSGSRWSSLWGRVRRSVIAWCYSIMPMSFPSLDLSCRHFVISHHHKKGENSTMRSFERERNYIHIAFIIVSCHHCSIVLYIIFTRCTIYIYILFYTIYT